MSTVYYRVLKAPSAEELGDLVTTKIQEGWSVSGGLVLNPLGPGSEHYMQAVHWDRADTEPFENPD